jgi:hypothetical protein
MTEDPFKNVREMVAVTEDRLRRETERYSEVSERLFRAMAERPGSEQSYRENLSHEFSIIPTLWRELAYWRSKLPPFAEARDGYILLHPVTPENAHLLSAAPTSPDKP